MFRTREGSTAQLLQLCVGYFVFYVITGVTVKYFLGSADAGFPGMKDAEYLVYSTFGGTAICLSYAIARRWYRIESNQSTTLLGRTVPTEFLYILPSGVCTAVVIPTTTLMYSLPISVMVAMVIMRGAVIVISRAVDAIQIRQGILKKKVFWEENVAVGFAILAVSVHLGFELGGAKGGFDFLRSPAAVSILGAYIVAYSLRIYIMNYYKNTRPPGVRQDNRGFFGVEQISASVVLAIALSVVILAVQGGATTPQLVDMSRAVLAPHPSFSAAILSGTAFGVVAFFSVFIFMFKGRTATFAGLVNRLTSLVAGTTATLVFHYAFGGKFPKQQDWVSLGFILVAVAFLTRAERKRARELAAG